MPYGSILDEATRVLESSAPVVYNRSIVVTMGAGRLQ